MNEWMSCSTSTSLSSNPTIAVTIKWKLPLKLIIKKKNCIKVYLFSISFVLKPPSFKHTFTHRGKWSAASVFERVGPSKRPEHTTYIPLHSSIKGFIFTFLFNSSSVVGFIFETKKKNYLEFFSLLRVFTCALHFKLVF